MSPQRRLANGNNNHRHPRDLVCFKKALKSIGDQLDSVQHEHFHSESGGASISLDLSNCGIASCYELSRLLGALLPKETDRSRVISLDLNNNRLLGQLPIKLMQEMKSLRILFLTGNAFSAVPPGLETLTSVTRLSLKSNNLVSVDAMQLPGRLLHLILTDNKISRVRNFGRLRSLKKLMLAGNELTRVDELFAPWKCNSHLEVHDDGANNNNNNNAALPVRFDNAKIHNKKGRRNLECAINEDDRRMVSLELVRLARNKLSQRSIDIEELRQVNKLPRLKWLSLAANPLSDAKKAEQDHDEEAAAVELFRGVSNVTDRVEICHPKSLGGGASGIVVKCVMKRGESNRDDTQNQQQTVVLKFFKAISSDGGDKAEIAALKQLMATAKTFVERNNVDHSEAFRSLLLLPVGLADFGGEVQATVCKEFPKQRCPSRFAAVFPLVTGHPLAVPPDIDTITADQYPPPLYRNTAKPLWDQSRGGGEIHVDGDQDGESMVAIPRSPPFCLTYSERFQIVKDIVAAVAAMHQAAGVIHGDVYAHNIFAVNEHGTGAIRGKLLDFGASYSVVTPGGNCHQHDENHNDNNNINSSSSSSSSSVRGGGEVLPLRPCIPVPPGLSRIEGRSLTVFAVEMLDPRRIPLCNSARPRRAAWQSPAEQMHAVELEALQQQHHGRHGQHDQQQQQHVLRGGAVGKIAKRELLAAQRLSNLVAHLQQSSYIVMDIKHLRELDALH